MKQYIQPATIVATEIKNNILAGSTKIIEETTTDQYTKEQDEEGFWNIEW